MNDFYVGYLPKAPTVLARFVRRVIIVLGLLAVTTSLVLVVGLKPVVLMEPFPAPATTGRLSGSK